MVPARPKVFVLLACLLSPPAHALTTPPLEFPDRLQAPAAESKVDLSLYDDPEWAQSWSGRMPDKLRNSARDHGFNYTRLMVPATMTYVLDKIVRTERHDKDNVTILDVGSGCGYFASQLGKVPHFHVIAYDRAQATLDAGKELWDDIVAKGVSKEASLEFVRGEATSLPFPDSSVDVVLALHVFEQIPDLRTAFKEFNRVLKEDGVLVFATTARTLHSWMAHWWHTSWQRDMPAQVFDWRLGVSPREMKQGLAEVDMNMVHEELVGLCDGARHSFDLTKFPWVVQTQLMGFKLCKKNLSVRYFGWAYKKPTLADDDGEEASHDEL